MAVQSPSPRANNRVCVLNVKWISHDLGESVNKRYEMARDTFEKMGFTVEDFLILPSQQSEGDLTRKLGTFFKSADRSTLYIVYYHGHGYVPVAREPKDLMLFSHNNADLDEIRDFGEEIVQNRLGDLGKTLKSLPDLSSNTALYALEKLSAEMSSLQDHLDTIRPQLEPRFEISFNSILSIVLDAKGDVLVILDCCDAGAAANATAPTDIIKGEYNKHAIFACREGSTANGDMTSALCEMLTDRRNTVQKTWDGVDKAWYGVNSAVDVLRTAEKELRSVQLKFRTPRPRNYPQKTTQTVEKGMKAAEKAMKVVGLAKKEVELAKKAFNKAKRTAEDMPKIISGREIKEGLIKKELKEVEEVRLRSRTSQSGIRLPLTLKATPNIRYSSRL